MHTISQEYKAIACIRPQVLADDADSGNIAVGQYEDDAAVVIHVGDCSDTIDSTCLVTVATSQDGGSEYTTAVTFALLNAESIGIAMQKLSLFKVTHVKVTLNVTVGEESGAIAAFPIAVDLLVESSIAGSAVNSVTPA